MIRGLSDSRCQSRTERMNKNRQPQMAVRPDRFIRQFPQDLKLWLFCVAFLELNRVVFIFAFRGELDPVTRLSDVIRALLTGARFDATVASIWVFPAFLLSLVCVLASWEKTVTRLRCIVGVVFALFTPILCTVSLGYYKEFHDLFGPVAFGIYYDDVGAVLQDVLKEFNVVPIVLATAVVALVGQWLIRRILRSQAAGERLAGRIPAPSHQIVVVILAMAAMSIALRGSAGLRAIQLSDAGSTRDEFLNKTVVNPYVAARHALEEHFTRANSGGLASFLPDGDIRAAIRQLWGEDASFSDLDSCMIRLAKGPKGTPPRHIFILVEETYDMWPLLPKYASLRLTERLKALAAHGLYLTDFLPSSDGTMTSLSTIITGLADAGLVTNYQESSAKPYPSSLAGTFNRLGYKTSLFYGGYLTWQRIGNFAHGQGFENVYGAADIPHSIAPNEWGVDDKFLFDFILEKVGDSTPTFSLILTTTYHPPYSIDIYGKGYPVREVPEDLRASWGNTVTLKMLGHLWWADQCLGEFVDSMNSRVPNAAFAMTGDHSNRKFINSRPNYYEHSAVPLVLYGPGVLSGLTFPANAAGSHLDIGTTLIELTAPAGFPYYALGQDLLAPEAQFAGIGRDNLITSDFELELVPKTEFHPLPQKPLPDTVPDIGPLKRRHDAIHAVSWWRIKQCPKLPPPTPHSP